MLPTDQRDPRENPTEEFSYVDIASVDNEAKAIVATKRISGAGAPSRARKVIRKGDVIVSTVRPNLNAVALVPDTLDNHICSTGFSVLRPSAKVVSGYLFAFARSPFFIDYLVSRATGASYPAVNDGEVKGVPIPVPPVAEQERIVKLLDEADALLRLREQADRRAASLLAALFHETVGDPATNPKNWPVVTLGKIGGNGQYGLNAAAMTEGNGIRFIRITDIDERGRLGRCVPAFVPNNTRDLEHYELVEGDILIARSGATAGKAYVHGHLNERSVFAGYLIRFKIDQTQALPIYVFSFLKSKAYWTQLNSHKRAVAQPNVNAKELASLQFPLPPLSLQKQFATRAYEIRWLEAQQAASRSRLNDLFQSMLHRAFNGEL